MILFFFYNDSSSTVIYTLSLHDALPISKVVGLDRDRRGHFNDALGRSAPRGARLPMLPAFDEQRISRIVGRSEEHTSELQSRENLVCRLLLEKKKKI